MGVIIVFTTIQSYVKVVISVIQLGNGFWFNNLFADGENAQIC